MSRRYDYLIKWRFYSVSDFHYARRSPHIESLRGLLYFALSRCTFPLVDWWTQQMTSERHVTFWRHRGNPFLWATAVTKLRRLHQQLALPSHRVPSRFALFCFIPLHFSTGRLVNSANDVRLEIFCKIRHVLRSKTWRHKGNPFLWATAVTKLRRLHQQLALPSHRVPSRFALFCFCWEVPGEITDRNAAEVDANLYRWWGSYTPTHGQRCWYIELCVVWDGKRAGPWWIGHHAPKSRVFSSKRRRDDFEIGVNRQSDGRSENSVLLFKISSFRKGDVCDIYLNKAKKQLTIVNIRII
jgi:hypothetical protein